MPPDPSFVGLAYEDESKALLDRWKSEQEKCLLDLSTDSDRRDALIDNSPERVTSLIQRISPNSRLHREFAGMENSTQNLKTFIEKWLSQIGPSPNFWSIWALYRFLIRDFEVEDDDKYPIIVLGMLREVFNKTTHINLVLERTFIFTEIHKDACIDFACCIMEFLVSALNFIEDTQYRNRNSRHRDEMASFEKQKENILRRLDQLTAKMEKANAQFIPTHTVRSSMDSSSWILPSPRRAETFSTDLDPLSSKRRISAVSSEVSREVVREARSEVARNEVAKLPCMVFPKARATRLHDRRDELKAIDDYFSQVYDDGHGPSNRLMALFGLGGTGKSTVAIKYAEMKRRQGELDAFLWIASETRVTLKQSIAEITQRLKLPDAKRTDDDVNKEIFQEWLEGTRCRCLVVFDNVEDLDLVREFLPFTSQCHFLITTRNRTFENDVADRVLEVPAWDKDEGLRFLRTLLNAKVKASFEEDESAQKLSMTLDGHAFAITTVAGHINKHSQTIAEFITYFEEYKQDFFQEGGSTVNTICNISFQGLDRKSAIVLGVMAYLEPDNIPLSIFEPPADVDLPKELADVVDKKQLNNALESLYATNLVKRDSDEKAFSLHRLVQQSYKTRMTLEERQVAFNYATLLVSAAFPRHGSTNAQLYLMWEKCALCLPQVMRLKDAFNEERLLNKDFRPLLTFCDMNSACQRYLLEKYAIEELESLLETNLLATSMFPEPQSQKVISLMGNTTSHKGQMLVKTGRIEEGLKWLEKSYHYFCSEIPRNARECGWAADNAADGYHTANRGELAHEWHKKARSHFMEWSSQDPEYAFECPAALIVGSAVTMAWIGKLAEARADIMEAHRQIELEDKSSYDWAVAAWVRFTMATISFHEKNYGQAEQYYMETQNLWLRGEQNSSHPVNGACKYRLGCMALEQGRHEAAVNFLTDAVGLTKTKKKHMAGEYMRCIFKLSEALEQDPRSGDKAKQLREEAEKLLHDRFPDNTDDPGREETYDRLVCITWR